MTLGDAEVQRRPHRSSCPSRTGPADRQTQQGYGLCSGYFFMLVQPIRTGVQGVRVLGVKGLGFRVDAFSYAPSFCCPRIHESKASLA